MKVSIQIPQMPKSCFSWVYFRYLGNKWGKKLQDCDRLRSCIRYIQASVMEVLRDGSNEK